MFYDQTTKPREFVLPHDDSNVDRYKRGDRAGVPKQGFVFYRGPSQFNGEPIIGIATLAKSSNPKTGPIIQTWIIREDIDPAEARRRNEERANCNGCPLQGAAGACYVNVGQAPLGIFRAYHRGRYCHVSTSRIADGVFSDRMLRMGSYGDPTAIPLAYWLPLLAGTNGHLGYTHTPKPEFKNILMASVETESQAIRAHKLGWRTFRARKPDSLSILDNELMCPAISHGITCEQCKLCCGASRPAKNIVLPAHGPMAARMYSLIN